MVKFDKKLLYYFVPSFIIYLLITFHFSTMGVKRVCAYNFFAVPLSFLLGLLISVLITIIMSYFHNVKKETRIVRLILIYVVLFVLSLIVFVLIFNGVLMVLDILFFQF